MMNKMVLKTLTEKNLSRKVRRLKFFFARFGLVRIFVTQDFRDRLEIIYYL